MTRTRAKAQQRVQHESEEEEEEEEEEIVDSDSEPEVVAPTKAAARGRRQQVEESEESEASEESVDDEDEDDSDEDDEDDASGSDSDDAPEEVSHSSARDRAAEQRRIETEARAAVKAAEKDRNVARAERQREAAQERREKATLVGSKRAAPSTTTTTTTASVESEIVNPDDLLPSSMLDTLDEDLAEENAVIRQRRDHKAQFGRTEEEVAAEAAALAEAVAVQNRSKRIRLNADEAFASLDTGRTQRTVYVYHRHHLFCTPHHLLVHHPSPFQRASIEPMIC